MWKEPRSRSCAALFSQRGRERRAVPSRRQRKNRTLSTDIRLGFIWWTITDSNRWPFARQANALPAELNVLTNYNISQLKVKCNNFFELFSLLLFYIFCPKALNNKGVTLYLQVTNKQSTDGKINREPRLLIISDFLCISILIKIKNSISKRYTEWKDIKKYSENWIKEAGKERTKRR